MEQMQELIGDIPVHRELLGAGILRIWVPKVPEIFITQDGGQPVKEALNTALKWNREIMWYLQVIRSGGDTTRGIKVTVTSVDGEGKETEIGTSTYTMSGEQKLQKQTKVTVPEDSNHILVTVSKASGSDPVLSWIGIIKTDQTAPETGDNLLVNGSFENGTDGWNLGAGASVLEGENCPDGTHYLEDNGNIYDWGDGSNQEVSVEPNTEYVLTGNIKVSGNKVYYAGVNVDGKEIYCVASTDSNYTDTTNTDKKQAYQVAAGATDWMPFEIRFTTPENINTVKMYTWTENGAKGYLDHLELKEVSGGFRLDRI